MPRAAAKKAVVDMAEKYAPKPGRQFWLMKSEPESRMDKGEDVKFSLDDLAAAKNGTECWEGVRNHTAKNIMRYSMKVGDGVLFYHSNCKEPGVVGLCTIVKAGYPDFTQWDKSSRHYDAAATKTEPRWWMVDIKFERKLKHPVGLQAIKADPKLADMVLVKQGRLSVQPVTSDEYEHIVSLGDGGAK